MARPQKFRHQREDLTDPKVAEKLGRFVIEIEDLREQRSKIDELLAAAFDAVDDNGFEKKFVRKVIALRAKEDGVRRDEEDGLESYEFAIEKGVSLARTRRKPANDKFDPITGEFVEDNQVPSSEQSEGNGSRDHQHVHSRQTDGAKHGGQDGEPAGADHAINSPGTAEETPKQVYGDSVDHATAGPSQSVEIPAGGDQARKIDGSDERYPAELYSPEQASQSDDGAIVAVNGKAGLANADGVEPPSSGHFEFPSAEREDCAAANAGGDHEVASIAERERETVTSNTGEGAANTALPDKPKFVLRPHCKNPGLACGGHGSTHCHACLKARKEEMA